MFEDIVAHDSLDGDAFGCGGGRRGGEQQGCEDHEGRLRFFLSLSTSVRETIAMSCARK